MSARVDFQRLGAVLVLVICMCSLAVHFLAEGLSPAGGPFSTFVAGAAHTHLAHEHSDDNFVLSRAIPSSLEHSSVLLLCPAISGAFPYTLSPLLPPPNF